MFCTKLKHLINCIRKIMMRNFITIFLLLTLAIPAQANALRPVATRELEKHDPEVHFGEGRKSKRELEAWLVVCLAVVAYNTKTGENFLAHFLPNGHRKWWGPDYRKRTNKKNKKLYIAGLLRDIRGPSWNAVIVTSGVNALADDVDKKSISLKDIHKALRKRRVRIATKHKKTIPGWFFKIVHIEQGIVKIMYEKRDSEDRMTEKVLDLTKPLTFRASIFFDSAA